MTDISKCEGKDCKKKDKCWRYTAPSSSWQAYSDFDIQYEGKKCEYFESNKGKR